MKKKLLALLIAGAMLSTCAAGLFGCSGNNDKPGSDTGTEQGETDKPATPHSHTFNKQIAEAKFLKTAATCTEKAVYYLSCECGEKGTATFETGQPNGHSYAGDQRFDEHSHWQPCGSCNQTITATHQMSDKTCGVCGFHAAEGLATAEVSDGLCVTGIGEVTDDKIFIPSQIDGLPVTEIGKDAFRDNESITQIIVPSTVKIIGADAFNDCKSLKEFLIYNVNPAATAKAFNAQSYINDTEPTKTTEIGERAFENCTDLVTVEIPETITSIGEYAFSTCVSLKNIVIPDSVTSIGEYTFAFCVELAELNLCDNVSSIGYHAFEFTGLTTFTVPAGITEIGGTPEGPIFSDIYGLCCCYNLESVYIPSTVTKIERGAFSGNWFIIYCEAENKPESFKNEWNDGCDVIWDYKNNDIDESGYVHATIDGIRYALKDGEARIVRQKVYLGGEMNFIFDDMGYLSPELTSYNEIIIIPEIVTYNGNDYAVSSIGYGGFSVCMNITEIVLPEGLTEIDDYGFDACECLKKITLPLSLQKLGIDAFWECIELEEIHFGGTKEQWLDIEKGTGWNIDAQDRIMNFVIVCTDGKLDSQGNEVEQV